MLPKSLLKAKAVARKIIFHSTDIIENFHVQQLVSYNDKVIEVWNYRFGFVIPGSTNTWEVVTESAKILPLKMISGKVVIFTSFWDGDTPLCVSKIRLFYS
ncbi:GMP phosphodiesterase, delta subunit [Kipferlia bialata]|uniref:GMP phosphodiesterase, delta subunit n=1 Tax=Kipferlia bialata TaxID=797122 RepID=A0A9K3GMP8_9EUKA|nr:GMP phosphodiesterase, delta subunit [Kipferlia bialata]|eukprot:g10651.t1